MEVLTLDEIARRAGVSRTTASRVLNNQPNVRPEVRERVQHVIEETGYRPNPVARSLAIQRTHILGLVLPRRSDTVFTDPYFPVLIQGIAQACNDHEYTLGLFLLQTPEEERKLLPRIAHKGLLDGLIIQVGEIGDQLIALLLEKNIPLVVAGRPAQEIPVSYIDVDNVTGAYQAVSHLIRLGHTRIGTITGALNTTAALDRRAGYEQALHEHGLPLEDVLITPGNFNESSGYQAMQQLLPHRPTAVFVASDVMVFGALRALSEAGLRVPEDMALVGYDDLPPAANAVPPLTTVHQPVLRFGEQAVEILIDILENGSAPPRRVILDTQLIIRNSCGASGA